jgi:hypothetical protein
MVDGSSASMPDTPELQRAYGQPAAMKLGCGFPVMHLLALFDQATGMIVDLLTHRGDTHDMAHACKLHPMLDPGDVLLGRSVAASRRTRTVGLEDSATLRAAFPSCPRRRAPTVAVDQRYVVDRCDGFPRARE